MPGNFGIPSEGAQLEALNEVTDGNSDLLQSVIEALLHPITVLLTDNECLLSRVEKQAKRFLGAQSKDNDVQLHRIVDALYAHLALLSGANEDQLNRALALASQLNPQGDVNPAALIGGGLAVDIQQVLAPDPPLRPVNLPLPEDAPPAPAAPEQPADFGQQLARVFGALEEQQAPAQQQILSRPATIPCGPQGQVYQLPDMLAKGLPLPGSAAFYDSIEVYIGGFEELGLFLANLFVENVTPDKILPLIRKRSKELSLARGDTLWDKITLRALEWLVENSQPVLTAITRAVTCVWELYKALLPDCRLGVVLGLTAVRAVVRSVSDIEGGWDAFVWAVGHVRIELVTAENLLDHLILYACPMGMPSAQEATEAWSQGRITEATRDVIWKWEGFNPETYKSIALTRLERVDPKDYIQYLRRIGTSKEDQIAAMTQRVFQNREEAAAFVELYEELPTINDHLHWLQRNVFDEEYVKDYNLDSGFEEKFWPKFGPDLTALGMRKEYARLHYEAHWINASPEQMREFVYRLREGKAGVNHPFTPEDFQRLLAEQDYSPLQRAWFAETLFRVPALGYLRDMYRQNLLNDEEMRGYHQDLGYSESDSQLFVRIDKLQRDRMRATQGHGWNPAAIAKAYALRQRGADWVQERMQALGYTDSEAEDLMERADIDIQGQVVTRARSRLLSRAVAQIGEAIQVGILGTEDATQTLKELGFPDAQADGVARLESAKAVQQRIKHAVNSLRGAFHRGEATLQFVASQLSILGIVPSAVSSYVAAWNIERTPNRKRRQARQIVTDVAEAAITTEEGLARLENLGYENADAMLYLEDARRRTVEIRADRGIAASLSGKAKMDVQAQLARTADRLSKRLITDLQKSAPISKMQKWAKLGLVSHGEFTSRLTLYGVEPGLIDLWWKDACSAKTATCIGEQGSAGSEKASGNGKAPATDSTGGSTGSVSPSGD